MALSSLFAFRRRQPAQQPQARPPARTRRTAPAPGRLRRERRTLLHLRESRIRDLGGLVLEMYRQDAFREGLLVEHCAEIAGIEERLHELDRLLLASAAQRAAPPAARCACGAPLLYGSHFCANCGRAVAQSPVVACRSCGAALAADARYCSVCGTTTTPAESEAAAAPAEAGLGGDAVGANP